jgi:hypothetical protein
MYWLFLLLKDRIEPPNEEEKAIAAGRKSLDAATAAEYLKQLEKASTNIVDLFNQQNWQAAVSSFPHSHLQLICNIDHRSKAGIRRHSKDFFLNG